MSYTNTTQYYNLPQFASTDVPTWDDINTAFSAIDTALHDIASSSGISAATAQSMIDTSLAGAIFTDPTNGTGITSTEYSKLLVKPTPNL